MNALKNNSFVWGAASSAYQIEGATEVDGRGASIWDVFTETPGRIVNNDTGRIACNSYFKFADDINLLADLGAQSYRFSISWPRILPAGKGQVNQPGLDYYKRLMDGLLKKGIKPVPTLFHWDSPQIFEAGGGWANRDIADYFADYAALITNTLQDFTDQVILINEPTVFSYVGYSEGIFAPGIRDDQIFYSVIHHLNLAAGKALQAIRAKYPTIKLGSAYTYGPIRPLTDKKEDIAAAELYRQFWQDCFLTCAISGKYPDLWQERIAPYIHDGDLDLISGSQDFIGINHYGPSYYKADANSPLGIKGASKPNHQVDVTDFDWEVSPDTFYETLMTVKERYNNPVIYITENGACYDDGPDANGVINDQRRINYLSGYIGAMQRAIKAGADIRGYYVWSLLDNFEWASGYGKRFGIVYVDFEDKCKRIPKNSYYWYKKHIANFNNY